MKSCIVVYALPERQWQWRVELPEQGTVADALEQARAQSGDLDVPWDTAGVGIYGEACERDTRPRDGDRVEIYRPLKSDPKVSRRARAAAGRAATAPASSRLRSSTKKAR